MKKSSPACQDYYTCRGETTRPAELSRPSRRARDPNVNGWLNFGKKQANCYLSQGSSGGGLSPGVRDYIYGALQERESDVLDQTLPQFYAELRKKNDYEPDCLKVLNAGITGELSKIKSLSKVHHLRQGVS